MEISQKVRTNAAISYFFLGFLFLLARKNPNFSEPFVRSHAKSATKLHLLFIGYIFLHQIFLSRLLAITLPFLPIRIDRILIIMVFAYIFTLLFIGASRAFAGRDSTGIFSFDLGLTSESLNGVYVQNESEMIRSILSFVPFIGPFIYEHLQTPLTRVGVRISGLMSILLVFLFVFSRGESTILSILFFFVVLLVSVASLLFLGKSVEFLSFFYWIPSLE